MPSTVEVIRRRHRYGRSSSTRRSSWILFLGLSFLLAILIGVIGLVGAFIYAENVAGLPLGSDMDGVFGPIGRESHIPVRIYDRSGEKLLLELLHPLAQERRWYYLDPTGPLTLPSYVVQATIASQDQDFWTNRGYSPRHLVSSIFLSSSTESGQEIEDTLTQQLVEAQVINLSREDRNSFGSVLQRAMLAEDLIKRYPKEKILEWYLNTANYGELAFGIDAASLVYFGKHASDLSLAEAAILAPLPINPQANPVVSLDAAKQQQEATLRAMVDLGMIDEDEAEAAQEDEIHLRPKSEGQGVIASDLSAYVQDELIRILGPHAIARSGLRVTSTVDYDLQLQTDCAIRSHLTRLGGAPPASVESALDETPCIASGLLPALRPADIGYDHLLQGMNSIILDTSTGEVLSLIGDVGRPHEIGSALIPSIYLTAFTQGYSPGTMILDIPISQEIPLESTEDIHGPVRMRTALANMFEYAAERTLQLVGIERVRTTLQSLGVDLEDGSPSNLTTQLNQQDIRASLLDIAYSYSIIANLGNLVGLDDSFSEPQSDVNGLLPALIKEAEDVNGRLVYRYKSTTNPVVSAQLAYLMTDVLSDESNRTISLGSSNPLTIGRPSAVFSASAEGGNGFWTIGFTPSHLVGVWAGNPDGSDTLGLSTLNSSTPVWHALMQYVVKDTPATNWEMPAGISKMEVCDPSGLLPTNYCPSIVQEIFIHGTEPTYSDQLYQPFEVNRETGKLATLGTPPELIEERVFLVPPAEASEWADVMGFESPPQEYDTLQTGVDPTSNVAIMSPDPFEFISGEVVIRGRANLENGSFYRLQYGEGLNPPAWIQIGDDHLGSIENGRLGIWDTEGLSGLYTLQLIAVDRDDQVFTSAVHLTIDSGAPEIVIVFPEELGDLDFEIGDEVTLHVDVSDEYGVKEVIFLRDNVEIKRLDSSPYSIRFSEDEKGTHALLVRAVDQAGNWATSDPIEYVAR